MTNQAKEDVFTWLWDNGENLFKTIDMEIFFRIYTVPEPSSGLSAGAIAGIVITCFVLVAAAAGGGYFFYKKKYVGYFSHLWMCAICVFLAMTLVVI